MNRHIFILYCCALSFFLSACTSVEVEKVPQSPIIGQELDTVRVRVPLTKADIDPNSSDKESRIKTARLLIVDKNTGKILVNEFQPKLPAMEIPVSTNTIEFNQLVNAGRVHWYLICNEDSAWFGLKRDITPQYHFSEYDTMQYINVAQKIDKKMVEFFGSSPDKQHELVTDNKPIPMAAIYKDLLIKAGNPFGTPGTFEHSSAGFNPTDVGRVKRLIAKVKFKIYANFSNPGVWQNASSTAPTPAPGGTSYLPLAPITIKSVKIEGLPKNSWLQPSFTIIANPASELTAYNIAKQSETTSASFSNPFNIQLTSGKNYIERTGATPQDGWFLFTDSVYIPEYIPQGTQYSATLAFNVDLLTPGANTDTTYNVAIGDGMSNKSIQDLLDPSIRNSMDIRITRNTRYDLNIAIVSYDKGRDQNLNVNADVRPWDGDKIDSMTIDVTDNYLNVTPMEIVVPSSAPYDAVLNIYTDAKKGWSVNSSVSTNISTISWVQPSSIPANQPSGQLKFRVTGGTFPKTIVIECDKSPTNSNEKIRRVVKIRQ
ncbi:MAG: hypothetical protein LBH04_05285 [Tannerellaceae bacterium]|nr:hypothetical protein [Tannerellaceae bacterium]